MRGMAHTSLHGALPFSGSFRRRPHLRDTHAAPAASSLRDVRDACDVVVLGTGVYAASIARQLAASGSRVVVACTPARETRSGPTRAPVFSADAHGATLLTSLYATAAPLLRAFEEELTTKLFLPSGALHLAPQAWLSTSLDCACAEAGITVQSLSRDELTTRCPAFRNVPRDWEARLCSDGGTLLLDTLVDALQSSCARVGAAWLSDVEVLECEDRGGSWRLLLHSANADTRRWIECEQLVLAPQSAPEARYCLDKLQLDIPVPSTPDLWCAVRPHASSRESFAALPAWRTHALLPDPTEEETDVAAFTLQGCADADATSLLRAHGQLVIDSEDARARVMRSAVQLLPALNRGASPQWLCTPIVACPDSAPVCSDIPGVESGRAIFMTGDAQHALPLSAVAVELLRCVTPRDVRLMRAVSMQREAFASAAVDARDAAAAAAAAAEQRKPQEDEDADRQSKDASVDDALSLFQGRAKRSAGTSGQDFVFMPRADRRGQR